MRFPKARAATTAALIAPLAVLAAGTGARADRPLYATLTHDQETMGVGQLPLLTSGPNPVSRPLSFGTAEFFLNDAQTQLTMTATIFNIDVTGSQTPGDTNDNLLNAHIHVGAPPGLNAPVRWGFFGMPDNDTMPKQLVVTPFASGVGGTFFSIWDVNEGNGVGTTLTNQLPAILAGQSYLNFHTVQFMGGEIRGQIVIPEPSTLALLGSGAVGLLGFGRRPRRRSRES